MVRKKKAKEYEEKIKQALFVLGEVSEDSTTPRNIRRAAKDAMGALQSPEFTPAVRAFPWKRIRIKRLTGHQHRRASLLITCNCLEIRDRYERVSDLKMSHFSQGQGGQAIARRRTSGTSHK